MTIAEPKQPNAPAAGEQSLARRALDNPWLIVAMLFFVTAALGLPLLWISRGFSPAAKVILSIVVVIYTVAILWAFWLFLVFMWNNFYAPYLT